MPTYKWKQSVSVHQRKRRPPDGSDELSFRFRNVMDYPNEQRGGNLDAPIVDATHEVRAVIDSATAEPVS